MTEFCWVHAEVRINHLTKSATYKIVRSASVIVCCIKRSRKSGFYLASRSINARELTEFSH
ncbi:hypothetical protein V1283_002746 [Bradyrhizobium sp. AZCC 2262]